MKTLIFESFLRENFVRSALIVRYDEKSMAVKKIYVNHYQFGTIEISKNRKEAHRWENEQEAQDISYLNRHFTTLALNGTVTQPAFEQDLLDAVEQDLIGAANLEHRVLLQSVLQQLKKGIITLRLPTPLPKQKT